MLYIIRNFINLLSNSFLQYRLKVRRGMNSMNPPANCSGLRPQPPHRLVHFLFFRPLHFFHLSLKPSGRRQWKKENQRGRISVARGPYAKR